MADVFVRLKIAQQAEFFAFSPNTTTAHLTILRFSKARASNTRRTCTQSHTHEQSYQASVTEGKNT
jgi:hypothetical protein